MPVPVCKAGQNQTIERSPVDCSAEPQEIHTANVAPSTRTLLLPAFLVHLRMPMYAHWLLLHYTGFPEATSCRSTDLFQKKASRTIYSQDIDDRMLGHLSCLVREAFASVEPTTHGTHSTSDHLCLSCTAFHIPSVALNPHRPYF